MHWERDSLNTYPGDLDLLDDNGVLVGFVFRAGGMFCASYLNSWQGDCADFHTEQEAVDAMTATFVAARLNGETSYG